jgi:hypothetical protein
VIGKVGTTPADGVYGVAVFRQPYAACPGGDITHIFIMDRVYTQHIVTHTPLMSVVCS